jgi:hypothetical protein
MVGITEISAIVAAAGVLFGVIYYIFDMGHQFKARQTDLIMRLHSQVVSKEFIDAFQKVRNLKVDDYDDFEKKYGPLSAEGPEQTAIMMMAMFMEGIGALFHRKLVDIEVIGELFPVDVAWKKLGPILIGSRKKSGNPEAWQWFENLYNEIKKREQRQ